MTTQELLQRAVGAKGRMATATEAEKNKLLAALSAAVRAQETGILAANAEDLAAAEGSITPVMMDRLRLTSERVQAMADGIDALIALPDPIGRILRTVERPNGLQIQKISVPYGVIAIIYESRPNVTTDAAALCLKAGSVCVLRGGKESIRTNKATVAALQQGAVSAGFPPEVICLVTDTTHASANELMVAVGKVDLLIPRGSARLIQTCVQNALVPCIETGTGICHIYVDKSADPEMAVNILLNAKASRPSVCNAAEVCLVHRDAAPVFLPLAAKKLAEKKVELRLDDRAAQIICGKPANEHDFDTEFLDYILAVKVVDSLEEAIAHIAAHSTHHSEAIVTADAASADRFVQAVDSAAVYVNASTRFTDGGEFGLGCEMGISTQKLGARGPMGLEELASYKYVIRGNGQIR